MPLAAAASGGRPPDSHPWQGRPDLLGYPEDLPIVAAHDELLTAIRDHQVVVIAGETGSGKTTQLPKICLELGRSAIGHTQPRRIAARSVAERIAEELGVELGEEVGYQVRFTDRSSRRTRLKVMTDGILLAELQRDRELRRYDTLVIDEAHERSLTIDFILGYVKALLPRRPDLKVIVTSATIDPERFARHFTTDPTRPVPVLSVSGRTYPVEIRYRPLVELDAEGAVRHPSGADRDQVTGICEAVEELWTERAPGPGGQDILVFLSGEREIRDAAEALRGMDLPRTEILPLYSRLSAAEQHRVFQRSGHRRIVLATNVAETSITVPGIRYVVDTGTARISRYSQRTKVQRLPIEPISQASATQRSGRCGRLADGIAIRLYSEEDFAARPEFTEPEILRTSLASVILQMTSLGLGDIARFPFIDAPDSRQVADGLRLLEELHAIEEAAPRAGKGGRRGPRRRLTASGRMLARLPVDPRLGRMLIEADERGCTAEVLVIVSALSIQDVRERPSEQQAQADQAHARFRDRTSDFASILTLWRYLKAQQKALSGSAFRRMCKAEYLHYLRVREWQDLHSQLTSACKDVRLDPRRSTAAADAEPDWDRIHQALLAGLLSHVGLRDERTRDYQGARGTRFAIFPGSALFKKKPDFVVSAELVETSRLWARVNAAVEPQWIEEVAGDLVKRTYAEPHWSRSQGAVMAKERATLYGVPLAADRPVGYWRIDPVASREIFLQKALVEGDWQTRHRFVQRNRRKLAEVEQLESRLRRKDLRVDDQALYEFFDARVPAEVVSQTHFDTWWKKASRQDEHLLDFDPEQLIDDQAETWDDSAFPRHWIARTDGGELSLDLDYTFAPGSGTGPSERKGSGRGRQADGVTVRVPILFLHQLRPGPFRWLIPGLRTELVTALIRSLPKQVRKSVVPAPDVARRAVELLDAQADPEQDDLEQSLERALRQLKGIVIPPGSWDWSAVPEHLRMHFQVRDSRNRILGEGEDLEHLQVALRDQVRAALAESLGTSASALPVPGPGAVPGPGGGSGSQGKSGRKKKGPASGGGKEAAGPALERDGLTEWPERDLPRKVDTVVSGQRITGWPALVASPGAEASEPTADVRIFSSEQDQRAAQRSGTISLLQRRLPNTQRFISDHLDNREKIVFTQNPHGSVDALIQDCTRAAVDKLVPAEPPWTRQEFDRLFDDVRAEQIETVFQVTALVAEVLTLANSVRKRIKRPSSMAAVSAFADIREQLDRLVKPGFVTRIGWAHLQHLPRYLKAMELRIDKLVGTANIQRDGVNMSEIQSLEDEFDKAVAAVPKGLPVPEALAVIEWELEELRVSLFAQELGTAHTVSAKRVRKALRDAAAR